MERPQEQGGSCNRLTVGQEDGERENHWRRAVCWVVGEDKVGEEESEESGHVKSLLVVGTLNKVPCFPWNHYLCRLEVFEEKMDPARKGRLLSVRRGVFCGRLER